MSLFDDYAFNSGQIPAETPVKALDGANQGAAASFAPWGAADAKALVQIVDGLNPEQKAAVEHRGSPLLIMAGAGSGKTRVLTRRIAHLLRSGEALPGEILAITFTNKAAAEMKERVHQLIGPAAKYMWVSTFHSACVKILRRDGEALGLKSSFSIYDQGDSLKLIDNLAKEIGVDVKNRSPKSFQHKISALKNELVTPEEYADTAAHAKNPFERQSVKIYSLYQSRLRAANAVDFDDLIFMAVKLLQDHQLILENYRRRFRHVLIDEYQDTNAAQYQLVKLLVGDDPSASLTVVGDSDQSIYAFRGATIRNIVEFETDFPGARTILLEQNYRSTQRILNAANSVISGNKSRAPKKLWTNQADGAKLNLYVADDDRAEARYIAEQIKSLLNEGYTASKIAVFYRANAQSRALEEQFMRQALPYKVIGGTRFYERKEIKDAIAYLKVLVNPSDEVNLRRIINTPKRGIGEKAQAQVAAFAQRQGISFAKALERVSEISELGARSRNPLLKFSELLHELRQFAKINAPAEVLDTLLNKTGYYLSLKTGDPQDESRLENLAELISVAADFEAEQAAGLAALSEIESELNVDEDSLPSGSLVEQFLEKVALVADTDSLPQGEDEFITLMTLHSAKGLEFPIVFLTGMEEGTFPHQRSLLDASELEEERRLAYVGITRAEERLFITRANMRAAWGSFQYFSPSRFLDDLPAEHLEVLRAGSSEGSLLSARNSNFEDYTPSFTGRGPSVSGGSNFGARRSDIRRNSSFGSGNRAKRSDEIVPLSVGDRITHDSFGMGTVLAVSGEAEKTQVEVEFRAPHGKKRLLLRYAPITKL